DTPSLLAAGDVPHRNGPVVSAGREFPTFSIETNLLDRRRTGRDRPYFGTGRRIPELDGLFVRRIHGDNLIPIGRELSKLSATNHLRQIQTGLPSEEFPFPSALGFGALVEVFAREIKLPIVDSGNGSRESYVEELLSQLFGLAAGQLLSRGGACQLGR